MNILVNQGCSIYFVSPAAGLNRLCRPGMVMPVKYRQRGTIGGSVMSDTKTLKSFAYDEIRSRIISCRYAPGIKLNEELLQGELGISRTPIRDALSRLEQEGLIRILPKKGILIAPFSTGDIDMVYEVRMMFEPYALSTYGGLLDNSRLRDFHEKFSEISKTCDYDSSFETDEELHQYIISVVPNKYILSSYNFIFAQNHRFRIASGRMIENRMLKGNSEHLEIVDACLSGDFQLASEKMRDHLSASKVAAVSLAKASKAAEDGTP